MVRRSPDQVAKALVERGAGDLEQGRIDAAIRAFNKVERRFGDDPTPAVRRWLASALGLRAVGLGASGRLEEAIASFRDMPRRFAHDREDPEVRKQLACALFNEGLAFVELGQEDEALAAFDAAVAGFGDDDSPDVLAEVAGAMDNKVRLLATAGRTGPAVEAADDMERRFGAGDMADATRDRLAKVLTVKAMLLLASDPGSARAEVDRIVGMVRHDLRAEVRRQGADALDSLARGLAKLGDLDAAAEVFGEIPAVFGGDGELASAVASARFNRAVALRDAGCLPEAAAAFAELAAVYEADPDPSLRRVSIGGLFNRAIVLCHMTDMAMAQEALELVVTRFSDDPHPQVADWVRRSREKLNEERLRGLHSAGRVDEGPADEEDAGQPARANEDHALPDVAAVIARARQLAAAGDVERALELVTERRRALGDRAPLISRLELDAERGWHQLSTGDANIAVVTLSEALFDALAALATAEATVAHSAEIHALWNSHRGRDDHDAIAELEFALQLRAERVEETEAYRNTLIRLGETVERRGLLADTRARLEAQVQELDAMAVAELLPDRPRLLTILAELSRREGRRDAARAAAENALDHAVRTPGRRSPIARAAQDLITSSGPRLAAEPPDAALRHAASAGLRLLGHDWGDRLEVLHTLESQGRTAEALVLVGGLDREPDEDPALRLAQSWLLRSADDDAAAATFDDAYQAARQAWARIEEAVSYAASSLGLLYSGHTGDTDMAVELLSLALRHRATRDEDRYLLAQTMVNLALAGEQPFGDNAGVEHRIVELPREDLKEFDRARWTLLQRTDLSGLSDQGQFSWTYTAGRRARWAIGLNLEVPGLPLGANLQAEVDGSEEFQTSFELPYGQDVIFYHRTGESPLAPHCVATPANF